MVFNSISLVIREMDNRTKWLIFIAIILVGGIFGYLFGSRQHNPELWACVGLALGFLIDLLIWYLLRKEHYKNPFEKDDDNIIEEDY